MATFGEVGAVGGETGTSVLVIASVACALDSTAGVSGGTAAPGMGRLGSVASDARFDRTGFGAASEMSAPSDNVDASRVALGSTSGACVGAAGSLDCGALPSVSTPGPAVVWAVGTVVLCAWMTGALGLGVGGPCEAPGAGAGAPAGRSVGATGGDSRIDAMSLVACDSPLVGRWASRSSVGVTGPVPAHGRSVVRLVAAEPTRDPRRRGRRLAVGDVDAGVCGVEPTGRTEVQLGAVVRVARHVGLAAVRSVGFPMSPVSGVGARLPFPFSATTRSIRACESLSRRLKRRAMPGFSSLRVATTTPSPRSARVPEESSSSNRIFVPVGFGAFVRRKSPAAERLSA